MVAADAPRPIDSTITKAAAAIHTRFILNFPCNLLVDQGRRRAASHRQCSPAVVPIYGPRLTEAVTHGIDAAQHASLERRMCPKPRRSADPADATRLRLVVTRSQAEQDLGGAASHVCTALVAGDSPSRTASARSTPLPTRSCYRSQPSPTSLSARVATHVRRDAAERLAGCTQRK
jgi:hypothetical protein